MPKNKLTKVVNDLIFKLENKIPKNLNDSRPVAKTEEEIKEKYKNISDDPKKDITRSFKKQGFKNPEEKADRFIKAVQNQGNRIRTATEGSFKKGGLVRQGKPKLTKKGWR
jgi:hypothetical protein